MSELRMRSGRMMRDMTDAKQGDNFRGTTVNIELSATREMPSYFGSREHATEVTKGRHPGVQDALQWLTFSHLPAVLRPYSMPFYGAACEIIESVKTDGPELTTALNGLVSAKDHGVRAGIKHLYGRAGSVSRPQEVVDPPFAHLRECESWCTLPEEPHHGACSAA